MPAAWAPAARRRAAADAPCIIRGPCSGASESPRGARHGAPARLSDRTPSERCVGCELDGRYANLGFGRLKLLASLDRAPRNALPPLTLDVVRFARAKLVREVAERPDGDGRPAFSGHLAALNRRRRNRRACEIWALSENAR